MKVHLWLSNPKWAGDQAFIDAVAACAGQAEHGMVRLDLDSDCGRAIQARWPERIPRSASLGHLVRNVAGAVVSVTKTSIGIDRVTDDEYAARLAICKDCPGGHVILNADGSPRSCGSMLHAAKARGEGPCGCVLSLKARDRTEDCPKGYWPEDERVETTLGAGGGVQSVQTQEFEICAQNLLV